MAVLRFYTNPQSRGRCLHGFWSALDDALIVGR